LQNHFIHCKTILFFCSKKTLNIYHLFCIFAKNKKKMLILSEKIIQLIVEARSTLAKTANSAMVYTYFNIGRLIVEEFQQGNSRAEYGEGLLIQLLRRIKS